MEGNDHQMDCSPSSHQKKSSIFGKKIMAYLIGAKIPPIFSQIIVYGLLPLLVYLLVLLVVGKDTLPGGTVFVIVLLECGGRLLGMGYRGLNSYFILCFQKLNMARFDFWRIHCQFSAYATNGWHAWSGNRSPKYSLS